MHMQTAPAMSQDAHRGHKSQSDRTLIQRIRRRHVYLYKATNIQKQPRTMAAVVPQKPMILSSSVDFKFMPKMPAIMAPMPAAKPAIDKVNSSLLTYMSQEQPVNATASTHKFQQVYVS